MRKWSTRPGRFRTSVCDPLPGAVKDGARNYSLQIIEYKKLALRHDILETLADEVKPQLVKRGQQWVSDENGEPMEIKPVDLGGEYYWQWFETTARKNAERWVFQDTGISKSETYGEDSLPVEALSDLLRRDQQEQENSTDGHNSAQSQADPKTWREEW